MGDPSWDDFTIMIEHTGGDKIKFSTDDPNENYNSSLTKLAFIFVTLANRTCLSFRKSLLESINKTIKVDDD